MHYLTVGWILVTLFEIVSGLSVRRPEAFRDYEDAPIKVVEISEKVALIGCTKSKDVVRKFDWSYAKCFGIRFKLRNWGNLASAETMNDYQGKEMCFYEEMGWTDGKKVLVSQVKSDLSQLKSNLREEFMTKVDQCLGKSETTTRNKREINGEVRRTSPIQELNKKEKIKKKAKKGRGKHKKGKKKSAKRKPKSSRKRNNTKRRKKKTKKGGRNNNKASKKKEGQKSAAKRKKVKGKKKLAKVLAKISSNIDRNKVDSSMSKSAHENNGYLGDGLYMDLWCIDLSFKQALQKCIEDKIQ